MGGAARLAVADAGRCADAETRGDARAGAAADGWGVNTETEIFSGLCVVPMCDVRCALLFWVVCAGLRWCVGVGWWWWRC